MKNPPPSDGKRLAILARKSDLKTESRGRSVKQQVEACVLAAKALGFNVDERLIFVDEDGCKGYWHFQDLEGRNPPPYRPELTRLVREVEAGNVDAVMCWRAERCYRDEIVAALFMRKLVAHGVRLFALTQDLFIHTTTGYTNAIAEANVSRAYSDKLGEDIKRHHSTNVKNGLLAGNPSMLGFRSAGPKTGMAVPVPEELAVVRTIYDWYVHGPEGEGPLSCRAIGLRLEEMGIRIAVGAKGHKAKYPDRVHGGRINSILRNAAYCGMIEYDGELYPTDRFDVPNESGGGSSAVPADLWHRAQERLDGKVTVARSQSKGLLCGLTVCPDCGRKTYPQGRGPHSENVYCANRGGRGGCRGTSYRTVKCSILEGFVREHLAPLVAAEAVAMRAERSGEPLRRELGALEVQLSKVQSAETETLTQHVLSGLDPSQVAAIAARLRSQREGLERRIAETRLRLKGAEAEGNEDPFQLLEKDETLLRQALARSLKWIAVTTRGLVIYTREGSVIGSRYGKGTGKPYSHVTEVVAPTVRSCDECLSWIDDPASFLEGLRRPTSWNRVQTPDDQLVPPELLKRAREASLASALELVAEGTAS